LNFLNYILLDTTTTAASEEVANAPWYQQLMLPAMLVLLIGVFYFFSIRPQRKRQKDEQKMRGDLRIGDQITTIGGIRGRVVKVGEDELVLETGADRTKIIVKKWAVQTNETVHDTPAADDDDDDI
jgi:preprotein translocase subunit YajC